MKFLALEDQSGKPSTLRKLLWLLTLTLLAVSAYQMIFVTVCVPSEAGPICTRAAFALADGWGAVLMALIAAVASDHFAGSKEEDGRSS